MNRILLIFMAIGLLQNCRSVDSIPVDPSNQKASTLVVGGILSKTGPAAAYGGEAERGAQLAIDQINASVGTLKIKYISMDDRSDKTEAQKVARTLFDLYGAQVILGPAISPSAISVGKLAEERQIPIVATSATMDSITVSEDYNRQYVSRVCFNDSFQGGILAKFTFNSLKKKRAIIVFDKTLPYSIGLAETFRSSFTQLGGVIVDEENYSVKDIDYSALIDKISKVDADILFIPGWDENVGPMIRQADGKWDRFILIGGDGWPTQRLLELAGQKIPESYASSHFASEDPNAKVQDFRRDFKAKYGEEPSPFAALGYDAMMLIHDAAKRATSFKGPDLMTAINASKNVPLVTGTLTLSEKRNPIKDVIIVKIQNTGFVFQERISP